MTVTVTDFERITKISRHTVYSWFYRDKFPEGVAPLNTIGRTRLLNIRRSSEYYEQIAKELV